MIILPSCARHDRQSRPRGPVVLAVGAAAVSDTAVGTWRRSCRYRDGVHGADTGLLAANDLSWDRGGQQLSWVAVGQKCGALTTLAFSFYGCSCHERQVDMPIRASLHGDRPHRHGRDGARPEGAFIWADVRSCAAREASSECCCEGTNESDSGLGSGHGFGQARLVRGPWVSRIEADVETAQSVVLACFPDAGQFAETSRVFYRATRPLQRRRRDHARVRAALPYDQKFPVPSRSC